MTRLLCVIVLVACGSTPRDPAHPTGGHGSSAGANPGGAPRGPGDGPIAQDSRRSCDALIDHAVTLAIAERPADQKLTSDERSKIVGDMRAAWSPKCKQMTGRGYDCALGAHSLSDFERCGG